LLARLPQRLCGYRQWLPDTWRIVDVIDRDDDDCRDLKSRLEETAAGARLATRTNPTGQAYSVVNRLAIEELETWYFGGWEALRTVYHRVSAHVPYKATYRDPDAIRGGTWEAFERILRRAGHFKGGLRKIEAARAIAPHMDPDRNTSHSFQVLRDALRQMLKK